MWYVYVVSGRPHGVANYPFGAFRFPLPLYYYFYFFLYTTTFTFCRNLRRTGPRKLLADKSVCPSRECPGSPTEEFEAPLNCVYGTVNGTEPGTRNGAAAVRGSSR